MARIDFYTLGPKYRGDRLRFACQLIEKIRTQHWRILVHCPEAALAQTLDQLLWSFRPDSFLAHGQLGRVDPELTPILISPNGEPEQERQVLINLGLEVPAFFSRFERVCELVDQTPQVLAAGRRRWAWYSQQSLTLEHHRLGG
ncbi:DNA polymerase III subunit chi [Rhabdochromatium marinum]|uniref:DNA polymerase III subunit chi n=1 Tax=Rhabdochromatium marinum TaxID=48729 RepID=UPI001908B9ED|nr:DNA polymerase III subunit chi [Rhabdochromatium marinum]MBK1648491.1 DNA polymerase III subunit chi [Rhabdochromatium marinum]